MNACGYEGDIAIDADEEVENGKNDVLEIDLTQNRACESVRSDSAPSWRSQGKSAERRKMFMRPRQFCF